MARPRAARDWRIRRRGERSIKSFQQAESLYAAQGHRVGVVEMCNDMGVARYRQQKYVEAEAYFQRALQIAREIKDRAGEGKTLGNLGSLYARLGKTADAESHFSQAASILREIGDQEKLQDVLKAMSELTFKRGRWLEAFYHYDRKLREIQHPNAWHRFLLWMMGALKRALRLPI